MGICDDVHHIILVDLVNRGTSWDNFRIFDEHWAAYYSGCLCQ